MRRRLLTVLMALIAVAALAASAGAWLPACSGTNPAAAPAPPIEMPAPAVLKFVDYDQLRVDLAQINPSAAKALPLPANILGMIEFGPNENRLFVETFFKPALQGISELGIPVSAATTQYAADITFSAATGFLAGTHHVALDFAPFDYDGDGTVEACSGNTAKLPICVRFKLDGAPYIAGVFEQFPYVNDPKIPDTIGKGDFRMFVADFGGGQSSFHYTYDQPQNANTRTTEYFFSTVPSGDPASVGFFQWIWHSLQSQEGPKSAPQAAAENSRDAFEALLSALPCVNGAASSCTCPTSGTMTGSASGTMTFNACVGIPGKTYTGTITSAGADAFKLDMSTFGDCTGVTGSGTLGQTCSGSATGTCAGASWSCNLELDPALGCVATCDGPVVSILKSISITSHAQLYPEGFLDFGYLGRFVDDGGFWAGSFQMAECSGPDCPGSPCPDPASCLYQNLCATLPDGERVLVSECQDVGPDHRDISVDAQPFPPAAQPADYVFPFGVF